MACKVTQVDTVAVSGVRFLPSVKSVSLQHCYRNYFVGCFYLGIKPVGNLFVSRTKMLKYFVLGTPTHTVLK